MYVCPPPRALWEGSSLIHLCNPNPALGPINSRHTVNVYWINDFKVVSSFAMFSNLHRKQINHYSLSLYFSGQWEAFFDIAPLHCYVENVKSAFWIREMVFACEDPDLSSSKLFWSRKWPQHERGSLRAQAYCWPHTTVDQVKVEQTQPPWGLNKGASISSSQIPALKALCLLPPTSALLLSLKSREKTRHWKIFFTFKECIGGKI